MPVCSLQEHLSSSVTPIVRMVTDRDPMATSGLTLEAPLLDVLSAAFSRDGLRLVTSSGDGTLRVWDTVSGHSLSMCAAVREAIPYEPFWSRCVAFSPDGSYIASSGNYGQLCLWNCASGNIRRNLNLVRSFVYSPDGENIAACCWVTKYKGACFRLWNIITGSERTLFTPPSISAPHACDLVFFSNEELRVAIYNESTGLRVWDINITGTNRPRALILPDIDLSVSRDHLGPEHRGLAFSSCTKFLALDMLNKVVVFAIEDHKLSIVSYLSNGDGSSFGRDVVISSDSRYVAVDNVQPYCVCIYDTHTGQHATVTSLRNGLCFSPDSGTLAAAGFIKDTLGLLRLETLELFLSAPPESRAITTFALSRDGSLLAVNLQDCDLQLVNTVTGSKTYLPGCVACSVFPMMDFSVDGHKLVYNNQRSQLEIYDVRDGTRMTLLAELDQPLKSLIIFDYYWSMSSCGERIAAYRRDGKIRIWDTQTGRVQAVSNVVKGSLHSLAFVSNDTRLLSTFQQLEDGSMFEMQLWDVETCTLVFALDYHAKLSLSPDGRCFVVQQQDTTELRNTGDGHMVATFKQTLFLHDEQQLQWSPDGSHFLTRESRDEEGQPKIYVWCSKTGIKAATLDQSENTRFLSTRYFFSIDGRSIIWADDHIAGCCRWVEGQHLQLPRDVDRPEVVANSVHEADFVALASGWLLCYCQARSELRYFLWVPPHRRQFFKHRILSRGNTMVLQGLDGVFTIVDTSGLLQALSS
jgi:WD40 repeat protein